MVFLLHSMDDATYTLEGVPLDDGCWTLDDGVAHFCII